MPHRDDPLLTGLPKAASAAEELFAKILRAIPVGCALSTAAEGRIIDVNDAFLHATGYPRQPTPSSKSS
jgi:PAS domain-containing protein